MIPLLGILAFADVMPRQSKRGPVGEALPILYPALARLRANRLGIAICLAVTFLSFLCFGALHYGHGSRSYLVLLDNIESRSMDARFQFRGPVAPDPNIVIAAIDQKTVDRLGWPFSRANYARMLRVLKQDGARVVAFDVDFPFPDRSGNVDAMAKLEDSYRRARGSSEDDAFLKELHLLQTSSDGDAQFAAAIEAAGNVVLGHLFFLNASESRDLSKVRAKEYEEILAFQAYPQVLKRKSAGSYDFLLDAPTGTGVEPNLRSFAEAAHSSGAFNFEADNDGVFRRAPLIFRYRNSAAGAGEENFYPSLDVEAARLYLGTTQEETTAWFNPLGVESIELGARQFHPDPAGRMMINYAGPAGTYPYYSMADIADGTFPAGTFRGKAVIVGASAIGVGDVRPTPFAKQGYPGAEIHANVLDNLLHERFLKRGYREEMTDLLVLILCGLGMGLVFVLTPPLAATLLYFGALAALAVFTYFSFAMGGRWLSLVLPASCLSLNYLGIISTRVLQEEREKRRVRNAFSQYVSPGHVASMLKHPERLQLGGEQVELTVLFSDIRSFTGIAEKMSAKDLVALLSGYLTAMTDIVFQNRGTLDKYIGDAVMAFWGRPFLDLPQHAAAACRAAIAMQRRLEQLNQDWEREQLPPLKIGVGINTGPMMVGNMGSLRRFNYTVMGDHVNLASRLEGLTKEYGVGIVISEFTLSMIGSEFLVRELDVIRVKGKDRPVTIYELMGLASDRPRYEELLLGFERGLVQYKAWDWLSAYDTFKNLSARFPSDGPAQLFMRRCELFLNSPPAANWDGVFSMTHK